ncbi:MAG: sugar ABC transporter ATP-binding protein [Chthonomonadales bacterium]|nr:sugar ABC transporter ATP-binding protein [Chthonomonadales bacterium]
MEILSVEVLDKRFPGVQALQSLTFAVRAGEVVAVVGENGAGKSTLLNLLSGSAAPDSGVIRWDGAAVRWRSPRDAMSAGIRAVHQEMSLFPHLSLAENLAAVRLRGWCRWPAVRGRAASSLARVGIVADDVLLARSVASLPLATAQLAEIAKALADDCRLLILDEPTSALSAADAERLFRVVRELTAAGVAVLFVSHRLGEVFSVADRILVLKDGRLAAERRREETTVDEVIALMVGRSVPDGAARRRPDAAGPPALEADGWVLGGGPPLRFALAAGQVVGLGGLADSGKGELLLSLVGGSPARGALRLGGRAYAPRSPAAALAAGVAYLPADRKAHGTFGGLSVLDNLFVEARVGVGPTGLVHRRAREAACEERRERFDIRTPSAKVPIRHLSGGNQQKCLLSRALESGPRVLLVDEPTRGVDVGARAEIHAALRALAAEGALVVAASSEVPELLHLCDRVLVMRDRAITADLAGAQATEQAISRAMIHRGDAR